MAMASPSPPPSPLPPHLSPWSPRPKVDRMFFTHGGSGPSLSDTGGTNKEIDNEEAAAVSEPEEEEEDGGGGKLYVAVGKNLKDGKSNLLWAARNLLVGDLKLVLLHVHQPAERIMTGKGIKLRSLQLDFCLIGFNPHLLVLFHPMLALLREKTDFEKELLHICSDLQKANEQRAQLENKLLQANSLIEELKQLQVELQGEKNHAVRQAEEMCQINGNTVFGGAVALTEFRYEEIKEATNNFDDSKKIGQGGCGSVYKGFLRHTTVAIKKFNREGATGEKEYNDEVETLCRMRHPNLITLIGVCREARVLVFEFFSNGSLEDCLHCKHQTKPLPWRTRIRIAANICTGLIFLHSNKPKGIAHGDLKPDNVLLDTSFVCKLADFGTSRPLNLTNTTVTPYHQTNHIKGTVGYMDPGYLATGELTAQSDVYSFGIILMRLLTGKNPIGLPNVVEAALSNEMLHDIIDTSAGVWLPEYTEELARLALRCCRLDRKERPDLAKEVWSILQAMMIDYDCKPPTFFICPMTQEIMRDPHIAADGFTYEGDAIKDWLQRGHKMSPMTYLSLTQHELIPNIALRFAIQEWQMQQQP